MYNNIYKNRLRFILFFFLEGGKKPPWIKIDVLRGSCVVVWYGGRYCGGGSGGGGGRRPTRKIHKNREKKETGNSLGQNGNTWCWWAGE